MTAPVVAGSTVTGTTETGSAEPGPRETGPTRRTREPHGDDGSIAILTLGWIVVVAIAVLVVAVASDLHVQRMRLSALADEIALTAVGSGGASYFGGESTRVLTDRAVSDAAHQRLGSVGAAPWQGSVEVLDASSNDGVSATVTLGRDVPLLMHLDVLTPWSDGVALTATGTARSS